MDLERNAPPKPRKGDYAIASRERRAERVAAEQKEMQAALVRDKRECRWPACPWKPKKLRIEAAHQAHRGMGGNPDGTRTTRQTVIALCLRHHQMWDHAELDIQPQTDDGFDGPVDFLLPNEAGVWEVVASEERRAISVERGL